MKTTPSDDLFPINARRTTNFWHAIYKVANFFYIPQLAPFFFRMKVKNRSTMEDYADLAFNAFQKFPFMLLGWRIRPIQIEEEIIKLAKIVKARHPQMLMEIGTARGGTLFLWTRAASDDATIISLDLPGGEFGGGYSKKRIPYYKSFAVKQQKIYLIRGNSHDPNLSKKIERELYGSNVDFLFIDADHTYDGVRQDFEMYHHLVGKGGIIAFHDICPSNDKTHGVTQFWNEIKRNYRFEEIIKGKNQYEYGIGVLYL